MLTWRTIIANGKVPGSIAADLGETARTMLGVATDLRGGLPDHLREVAPVVEVGHIWRILAEQTVVQLQLVVVEPLCDDATYMLGICTSTDVLAVPTAADRTAMTLVYKRSSESGE